jgi:predicted house-cleaning noncanonical NTP pyrophosphatase (MazG superfamily)
MKYYINTNKEIFAYEEDGSQDYLIGDKVAITIEEIEAINKAKEDEYKSSLEYKIQEAKTYLVSTDFKVLPDYDKEPSEVIAKRAEAREFIRANQGVQA